MTAAPDILELAREMKSRGEAFAIATVVRTLAATAAKAGAKALISPGGAISGGWIGGGCARAAVLRAAAALADGQPRQLSVRPADVLAAHGVASNDVRDGVQFAINACPSQGAMDIFVEPFLPRPHLVIFGASPVACALAELAARMGFFVTAAAPRAEHEKLGAAQRLVDGFTLPGHDSKPRHAVVATQGSGDLAALAAALESQAGSVAFVGSRRKATVLKAKLAAQGHVAARVDVIQAPAGLDIGAITPDEIALSIVAALIVEQRHGQRLGGRI